MIGMIVLLLVFTPILLLGSSVSGESTQFRILEERVIDLIKEYESNVSVFIETEEGIIKNNESKVMSSASIIKIPILVEAIRQAENGDLIWGGEVTVTVEDQVAGSGTLKDKQAPFTTDIATLANLMITVSDNTATNMLMERIGFDHVNWMCAEMGCEDTVLQNSLYQSMPQDRGPRNYTTAKDISRILKATNEEGFLTEKGRQEFLRIMESYPGARLPGKWDPEKHENIRIAHKGGSTANPLVRHDGAIFTLGDDEDIVYVAVLTHDIEDRDGVDDMMASIGETIMDYMLERNE